MTTRDPSLGPPLPDGPRVPANGRGALLLLIPLLLGPGVGLPAAAAAPPEAPSPGSPTKAAAGFHALLVGVTHYPNLSESYHLKGPVNDVRLLAKLLRERYGFPAENIRILSEDAGKDRLPTRKNIEAEFKRLAEVVRSGDRVVVLLGGHGSLQPQGANPRFAQPDGLDRIFLPRDVEKWDGGKGQVPNAIRGEELGAWLRPLPEKGASLWMIVDSCHSGQGIRGTDDEQPRQIDPEAKGGLGIPREAMLEGEKRAAERNARLPEKARGEQEARALPSMDGVTVLYACQATETTVEKMLPAGAPDQKRYGLLTFTVNQILTQADAPLSYLELAQRVQRQYVNLGRTSPTPLLEGKDRNREVMGLKEHPRRSLIRLAKGDDGLKITAGALHGLTKGSILAVYPPAGQKGDKPLGYVRVTEVETASAEVEPCQFKDAEPRPDLTEGRCELAAVDYGDMKLAVAVDPLDNQGKPVAEADRAPTVRGLTQLSDKDNSLIKVVTEPGKADWLVRLDSGKVYLVPGAGVPVARTKGGLPELFGPYPNGPQLAAHLGERLEQIARARNLLKLAGDLAPDLARDAAAAAEDAAVKVKVEVRLLKNKSDRKGQPVEWPNPAARFFQGDRVLFVVHNPNPYAVDVTLLDVGPDSGITCLFPLAGQGETSRIEANTTKPVPPVRIEGKIGGPEHLVVIAVKAKKLEQPVDFACLEQKGLEQALGVERTRGVPETRGLRSPLGQLLQRSQFGTGTRAAREEMEDVALQMYSWQFVADKRP